MLKRETCCKGFATVLQSRVSSCKCNADMEAAGSKAYCNIYPDAGWRGTEERTVFLPRPIFDTCSRRVIDHYA